MARLISNDFVDTEIVERQGPVIKVAPSRARSASQAAAVEATTRIVVEGRTGTDEGLLRAAKTHSRRQSSLHSTSLPVLQRKSLESADDDQNEHAFLRTMTIFENTIKAPGWSKMRRKRDTYPGNPLDFHELASHPDPEHYRVGAFDSSFGVNSSTGRVLEPSLSPHKRCVGVVKLGSGPEDLDAPRPRKVVERGKANRDSWKPFCFAPGQYRLPDLWSTFGAPQERRGSRFASKALKAGDRAGLEEESTSSRGGAKSSSAVKRVPHAVYGTDSSMSSAHETSAVTDLAYHKRQLDYFGPTAAAKKKTDKPRKKADSPRRKNALVRDASAEEGLHMGRQHLLIHALIRDTEEKQAEKRRLQMEKEQAVDECG